MPTHRLKIGQIECVIVQERKEEFPLDSLLPSIPADQLEQAARQEGLDPQALDFSINILVVRSGRT